MDYGLVYYGSSVLRETAKPIEEIDDSLLSLAESMFKIMYKNNGVGLAAPQAGVSSRLIVVHTQEHGSKPMAIINPEIIASDDNMVPYEEGCLSVPGVNAEIERPSKVLLRGISPKGKELRIEADGLLARVFQHETDHLNGKLFIDYVEPYQRNEIKHILKKIKKLNKSS